MGIKSFFCFYRIMGEKKIAFVHQFQYAILYTDDQLDEAEIELLKVKKINNVIKYEIEAV